MVAEVEPGGPADRAGLRAGDVILKVDRTEIAHSEELPRVVARHPPGSKVKVELLRDHGARTVDVTLDELRDERGPRTSEGAPPGAAPKAPGELGAHLLDVPSRRVVVERIVPG